MIRPFVSVKLFIVATYCYLAHLIISDTRGIIASIKGYIVSSFVCATIVYPTPTVLSIIECYPDKFQR